MQSCDRVSRAIFGPAPDRLPCGELTFDDGFVRECLGVTGPVGLEHRYALTRILGLDLIVVSLSHGWGASIQPDLDTALKEIAWWKTNTDLFVFGLVDGPFTYVLKAWGLEEAMHCFIRKPTDTRGMLACGACETQSQIRLVLNTGANGIILGDDIAYEAKTFVSPHLLRELDYFTGLTSIAGEVSSIHSRPSIFFHSDGNIRTILLDLAAAGFHGLQGVEVKAGLDLARVRSILGSEICLWGSVELDWLARQRPIEQIRILVREQAAIAGPRFILGTTGGLMAGLPIENVMGLYHA